MSALSQCVTVGTRNDVEVLALCFILVVPVCEITFSQKLIRSSEVWCQNTYAYLLGPPIQVLVLSGESTA